MPEQILTSGVRAAYLAAHINDLVNRYGPDLIVQFIVVEQGEVKAIQTMPLTLNRDRAVPIETEYDMAQPRPLDSSGGFLRKGE